MITRAKFESNRIVVYRDRSGAKASKKQLDVLSKNWSRVEYNGFMSKTTRRKLINMIQAWADSLYVKHKESYKLEDERVRKLRFLTLTLSAVQNMTDNEVKRRLLIPFISELKRRFGVRNYFWRAEAQKNGNIHFHLIVDEYLPKCEVNWLWDCHQALAGITKTSVTFVSEYHSPSTRIEAIQGVQAVAGYVIKYVTKDDGGRKIFGRIWGCSDELRNIGCPVLEYCNETSAILEAVVKDEPDKKEVSDYVIKFNVSVLRNDKFVGTWIRDIVEMYYVDLYDVLYKIDEL